MLQEGTEAPAFTLPDQDGTEVSLSDFDGQRVVVYFYPKANTRGCTIEAKGFRDRIEEFHAMDVAVVGISDDPIDRLADFAAEYDLSFSLLSDADGSVGRAYDSYGEAQIGDERREITFRNTYVVGPNGSIEHAYEGVSPDGHAGEVLADLRTD